MSTAKERQAKRRAKIKADPELYQAQLLKDREQKKRQREGQREKMSHNKSVHMHAVALNMSHNKSVLCYFIRSVHCNYCTCICTCRLML